jgi:predicted small metal-binding protein
MRRAVSGCNFVAQGNDDSEVMRKTAEHARSVHKMVAIAMESSGKREQQFGMPRRRPIGLERQILSRGYSRSSL